MNDLTKSSRGSKRKILPRMHHLAYIARPGQTVPALQVAGDAQVAQGPASIDPGHTRQGPPAQAGTGGRHCAQALLPLQRRVWSGNPAADRRRPAVYGLVGVRYMHGRGTEACGQYRAGGQASPRPPAKAAHNFGAAGNVRFPAVMGWSDPARQTTVAFGQPLLIMTCGLA